MLNKKNKNSKLYFIDYLRLRQKQKSAEISFGHKPNKLPKVLDIFIGKEGNPDLDDLSAYKSNKILIKFKDKLLSNPRPKKKKGINNLFSKKPEINGVVLAVKEKGEACKKTTIERIYGRPWIFKLIFACSAALILSVSICRFSPELCSKIADNTDHILYSKTLNFHDCSNGLPDTDIAKNKMIFSRFIINNRDNLKNSDGENKTFLITKEKLFGQAAKAAAAEADKSKNQDYGIFKKYSDKLLLFFENILEKGFDKQEKASEKLNEKLTEYLKKQNLNNN